MNTNKLKYLLVLILLVMPNYLSAQKTIEPKEPVEPIEAPDIDFEFDFRDFPGISEEEEAKLLKNLKIDLQKELKVIKNFNKEKYFDFLRESQFRNIKIPFMVKREKEIHERERKIFEAEIKIEALAGKYESAQNKDNIRTQLREQLSELFIQKEKSRQFEVEELKKELSELQKTLTKRQRNKQQIIERRLQELLNEEEYLDWD